MANFGDLGWGKAEGRRQRAEEGGRKKKEKEPKLLLHKSFKTSAFCPLPSALKRVSLGSPKADKSHNVVSFADNVVLRPPLFANNVVSKMACLQFEAFLFAVPYT